MFGCACLDLVELLIKRICSSTCCRSNVHECRWKSGQCRTAAEAGVVIPVRVLKIAGFESSLKVRSIQSIWNGIPGAPSSGVSGNPIGNLTGINLWNCCSWK